MTAERSGQAADCDAGCCSSSDCREIDRRTFVKLGGVGLAAMGIGGGLSAFAGPFSPQDTLDHFIPLDKKLDPQWLESLFARGGQTWYAGDDLKTIGMPVGGICAGQLYLTGDGRLVYWGIFNRGTNTGYGQINYKVGRAPTEMVEGVNKFVESPKVDQGCVVRVESQGKTEVRALDRTGFPQVRFCGEYPIAEVEYAEAGFPLTITLQAFSPFIPLNAEDSALPATLLHYTLKNISDAPVEATLAGVLENAVLHYSQELCQATHVRFSDVKKQDGLTTVVLGVRPVKRASEFRDTPMTSSVEDARQLSDFGTMAVSLLGDATPLFTLSLPETVGLTQLFDGDALASDDGGEKPLSARLRAAVGSKVPLAPGAQATITLAVTWHMPNLRFRNEDQQLLVRNRYAARFQNAVDVAQYVAGNLERLASQTRLWHDTYYDSTLPYWLLDRLHSTVANLATETCQWWENGRFWAWEGCGCCHGTCGHVWNYEHAMARLFPQLERSVREMQDLAPGVGLIPETGEIRFRGEGWEIWAGDAQGGYVLKAYREHQLSADEQFLKRNWPNIRQAVQFLIDQDANADGLIEGRQHQTYDQDYYGPNTMVGSLYLGALRAAEEMAREVGDADFATTCHRIFEAGRDNSVKTLFNGEYFVQKVDLTKHPEWQYADGCLADQMFGQGWAHQVALGYVYPKDTVLKSLDSIWRYCWAPDIGLQNEQHGPERWFAYPGEAGLFTCTWPKSKHLGPKSTRYRDEIWTGIEYQVANHMAYEGLLTESLAICRAVHDRYHPAKHNPFNEIECGDHYARAMASWGVLLGLGGFAYHGPKKHLGFAPRLTPEQFRSLFSTADAWGTYAQSRKSDRQVHSLDVKWGTLQLRSIALDLPENAQSKGLLISGSDVEFEVTQEGTKVLIRFAEELAVAAGSRLGIEIIF